jgi:Uma2 family endonuclease
MLLTFATWTYRRQIRFRLGSPARTKRPRRAYSFVMGSTQGLTLAEAMALPEDPLEEIVQGEIRKMPPPDKGHTRLLTVLARLLMKQLDERQYEVVATALGLLVRPDPPIAIRNPDLSVFATDDLDQDYEESSGRGYIRAVPKLIIECLSPANRKGPIKELVGDYSAMGVQEVWLLNPRSRRAERYHRSGEGLILADASRAGKVAAKEVPIVVSLDDLWHVFETGRER